LLLLILLCPTGEVTILALTSFYDISALSWWSSGTGFAGPAGAGFYVVLTRWSGWTPKQTLLSGGVVPVLYLMTYFGLLRQRGSSGQEVGQEMEETERLVAAGGDDNDRGGKEAEAEREEAVAMARMVCVLCLLSVCMAAVLCRLLPCACAAPVLSC